jgi:uncharacterized protein with NAD-binding domain and iron-sulfur cluster
MNDPKKIAVLGGGPAALTAVYYLLKAHDWDKNKVDITVYQMGWRLGGKCASGRNQERNDRIEEHGIHFWFGCYHNAFRWIRECYPRMASETGYHPYDWDEALIPCPSYVGFTKLGEMGWDRWNITPLAWNLPPDEELKAPAEKEDFTHYIGDYVILGLDHLIKHTEWENNKLKKNQVEHKGSLFNVDKILVLIRKIKSKLEKIVEQSDFNPENKLVEDLVSEATGLMHFIGDIFHDLLEVHETARRIFVVIDLGLTILKGMFRDNVFHLGFESINDIDFFSWLRKHGVSEITLENTLLRSYYDGAFAFAHGDKNTPNSEAGTTLMGIIFATLTTKTSMFWKFKGSMAEIVFTPFYLVLQHYGVKFKFFHQVKELKLTPDKLNVNEIIIGKQVNLKPNQKGEYDPLIEVKGIKCWPSKPKYGLIKEGDKLKDLEDKGRNVNLESFWSEWKDVDEVRLEKGKDFDEIIFGIPIGSIPFLCTDLIEANIHWRLMLSKIQTVATQAVQIWSNRCAEDLGWLFPLSTIYTTFEEPLDTWCANPDLVPIESWDQSDGIKDVFFFVGSLPDPGQIPPPNFHQYPAIMQDKVKKQFIKYLTHLAPVAFPRVKPSEDSDDWFNWSLLFTKRNLLGLNGLFDQYFRANVDPSERYVLSVVDSSRYRLKTDGSGFDNLYLVGDWIQTPLNSGCYEAAVMSGIAAARAISKKPIIILGEYAFKTHPHPLKPIK